MWSRLARSDKHTTDGEFSMQVKMGTGRYPGLMCRWPPLDWSEQTTLEFDVWNDSDEETLIVVRVDDFIHNNEHSDRFNRELIVKPGSNTVRIELADIENAPVGRSMDMTAIAKMQVFTVRPDRPKVFYFDRFELK